MSQPATPDAKLTEDPQAPEQKPAELEAPRPSYKPGPVVEDLIMTIERGLQIVPGDSPEHHRARELRTEKR
jgi:hypothetical protein